MNSKAAATGWGAAISGSFFPMQCYCLETQAPRKPYTKGNLADRVKRRRLQFRTSARRSSKEFNDQTCTGDDVIGCAYLGLLAHDKSEIEQWKNTVEHMGKEYKGTHHLKPPHSAPPVHVAETGDNAEDDD
ncbi:unnamed protein product [Haemonchus placei]|uniref:Uncharacterized protein n=1 Tax=Haemonchus placei TaxID=6290 RepID=A0A0N4X2M6_HAEPC|nr:unnamed protein product [Haemonchus placei]